MMLSDQDIEHELEKGNLGIDHIDDMETQLQPASFDVRLGNHFVSGPDTSVVRTDESYDGQYHEFVEDEYLTVQPDDFYLGTTVESLTIPDYIIAFLEGRSSIGRLGIQVHSTAGVIDPGWEGEITLEISNNIGRPVELKVGQRIGQITFKYLANPSVRPYGVDRGSKYNGQTGATPSQIHQDFES